VARLVKITRPLRGLAACYRDLTGKVSLNPTYYCLLVKKMSNTKILIRGAKRNDIFTIMKLINLNCLIF
ncbi:hypothetical protein, partial [Iningainema tapete]|uniref:hypothetical protein n=1 Tax=Iningainema tapete TaxID=2806730 RepID=UPI001EE35945